jgi:uncharacterized protein (TIGR02757 family)
VLGELNTAFSFYMYFRNFLISHDIYFQTGILTSKPYLGSLSGLRDYLENQVRFFNSKDFIAADPISVPHRFTLKQDIEITGFLSATIAWGNRRSIVSNANRLAGMMGDSPYEFLVRSGPEDFRRFILFVHRTFNGDDCLFFLTALKNIYVQYESLEPLFGTLNTHGAAHAISRFRARFLETEHLKRSEKHISDPVSGSAAKRINLFLRWMVRRDDQGVDFGLWNSIDPANLICPLDVHTGRVARSLGLLTRRQNDWKAAVELTDALKTLDPADPVKYDIALFSLGVNG